MKRAPSAEYNKFVGSVLAAESVRQASALRVTVSRQVARCQMLAWLAVVRRRLGKSCAIPPCAGKCLDAFLGDAVGIATRAEAMKSIAEASRNRQRAELQMKLDMFVASVIQDKVLPAAQSGLTSTTFTIPEELHKFLHSYNKEVRLGTDSYYLVCNAFQERGYVSGGTGGASRSNVMLHWSIT